MLDIHHLATGRGDATVVVAPDGRIALIDAGAVARPDPAQVAAMPNASRAPGEWIARYIGRRLRETGGGGLHAAMVTHLHPDHIGGIAPDTPPEANGAYRLTGVSEIAARLPVGLLLDPDYPDYREDLFEDRASAANYVAFARARAARGGQVERLRVGTTGQLLPDQVAGAASFTARIVASRGRVWTGRGSQSRELFASPAASEPADRPNENARSAAVLITYGPFRYFAGGDLTDWADAGTRPRLNALTPAAEVAGSVDVAVLPHHGMFDASAPATIRALRAKSWIISAWHAAHPSMETLERVLNPRLAGLAPQVFATALHPATVTVMERLTRRLAGVGGHVVCRVGIGGHGHRIVMTRADDEMDEVVLAGPNRTARSAGSDGY